MDRLRREVSQRLVGPPGVVALEPSFEPGEQRRECRVFTQINVLVFHAPPQPFDEHIVHPATTSVHADFDPKVRQPCDPFFRGELAALIRVEDLRRAPGTGDGLVQGAQTESGVHGV